ncbi:MAG: response regulator [Sphingobacteriales bacterium 17-39-43]|uniref:response regulator transcription factor n=1 Tax=Daejeonella sp. TaxID=2805397 RepID=UPI000BC7383E|nr:response regulator [Daejeonella sp.]OYZ31174.1 MAG: response regulator [Sphingobacteriales bacterium 16-39-50]OZA24053.1 MAG: response regulator [Sphingobacteriales bacterium 17-39-43]HQT23223.1 response regulator [Daejeonella sp.]HQT58175.1 response regulator [Daejeonella sp.]
MKILIAEDDELMLKTLEFRLKRDGHEILLARDGKAALDLIDQYMPDLVITDIMMPYSTGLEIVGSVKQKYPDKIKVIVLSGMGQESVILEAFRLGADDYITKPFSPNELSVRIRRFSDSVKN